MNKTEFIKAVSTECGFTQKDIKTVLEAAQKVTFETMKTEEVKLFDGVTFTSVYKVAHEARNPMTGDTVTVPGKNMPKVKLGKAIKDAVNA